MQRPQHLVNAPAQSPWKMTGLVVAGFVNIAFGYALMSGMATNIVRAIPRALEVSVITTPEKPQPTIAPPKTAMAQPDTAVNMPPPDIQIQSEPAPNALAANTAPSAPITDGAASAVGSTHTIPPYPPEARRLGQQGTVMLRLTISATGDVTAADVVQSSGYPDLDQTAAAWVMAHWKYKPAIQGGTAVESTSTAAVKFDLRKA